MAPPFVPTPLHPLNLHTSLSTRGNCLSLDKGVERGAGWTTLPISLTVPDLTSPSSCCKKKGFFLLFDQYKFLPFCVHLLIIQHHIRKNKQGRKISRFTWSAKLIARDSITMLCWKDTQHLTPDLPGSGSSALKHRRLSSSTLWLSTPKVKQFCFAMGQVPSASQNLCHLIFYFPSPYLSSHQIPLFACVFWMW